MHQVHLDFCPSMYGILTIATCVLAGQRTEGFSGLIDPKSVWTSTVHQEKRVWSTQQHQNLQCPLAPFFGGDILDPILSESITTSNRWKISDTVAAILEILVLNNFFIIRLVRHKFWHQQSSNRMTISRFFKNGYDSVTVILTNGRHHLRMLLGQLGFLNRPSERQHLTPKLCKIGLISTELWIKDT